MSAAPTGHLQLFANAGFADSDYQEVAANSAAELAGTDTLPGLPDHSYKIGFSYERPLGFAATKWLLGADLFRSASYFSEATNALEIPAFDRVNGYVGIGAEDDRWRFTLTGRNLADGEDYVSGIAGTGTNIRTVQAPAEWLATFRVNF